MTAWLPAAHPLASLPAFPVSAFAEESYIETFPDRDIDNARVFARRGVTPNLKFSTMDSLATYSMVEAGLGLSMNNAINGRAWSGNVRILPLDPPQKVEIGIACLDGLSPARRNLFCVPASADCVPCINPKRKPEGNFLPYLQAYCLSPVAAYFHNFSAIYSFAVRALPAPQNRHA